MKKFWPLISGCKAIWIVGHMKEGTPPCLKCTLMALIVDRVPVSQAGPEQAGRGRGRVPQDSHRQDCPLLLYRVNRRQNDLEHTNEYLHFNTILLPYAVRSINQFCHIHR